MTTLPATLLLVTGLAACSSGPPTDASVEDYCGAMDAFWVSMESTEMADHVAAAEALADSGTPAGAPQQAVDTVAAMQTWLEGDRDDETAYFTAMSTDQRRAMTQMSMWAEMTCSTGEVADLEDHPMWEQRFGEDAGS
ncbi:hypothetical protein EBM89_10225 [Cellulomonas triticagri]|uniref:Uncharacterized protein n=2 Tax=Cellulomonas triticagri TaxID=2483352 RepID=A0A3M2J5U3_9CELL|nr:hypothetical protein EBM89_10225 [Cellulomonas triticagri]